MTERWRGRFLRVLDVDTWEHVTRVRASGVVGVVAITDARELVLVEQHRIPLGTTVVELPAGLVGDTPGAQDEASLAAARRELHEETGFRAERWTLLTDGPSSAGLTDERVEIWLAEDLVRDSEGGGDATEDITVHLVPLASAHAFLREARARGALLDPKVFLALYVAGVPWDGRGWMG